ncbi:hypothetical protein QTJ16_000436 [Diplocarpon rosae]|uniref:Uncharacterized protein n=1 Tax=Diplocarpon rosae TaxID=946125 RepID=A0AAD9T4X9_9HELO|nr:hypothetical protein QTJ16_000436 [Diplocarpon rosae]
MTTTLVRFPSNPSSIISEIRNHIATVVDPSILWTRMAGIDILVCLPALPWFAIIPVLEIMHRKLPLGSIVGGSTEYFHPSPASVRSQETMTSADFPHVTPD